MSKSLPKIGSLTPNCSWMGLTRAADLVADDSFPALLAQPGDLRLKSVGLGGRQVEGFAKRTGPASWRRNPPASAQPVPGDQRPSSFQSSVFR